MNPRRFSILLTVLLLLCAAALPAFADGDTTITAVVPGIHTVTVACGEGGTAEVSGCTETETSGVYTADRFAEVTVRFCPEDGYAVGTPTISGCEESAAYILGEASLTFTGVTRDITVTVSFDRTEPEPQESEAYPILLPEESVQGLVTSPITAAAAGTPVSVRVVPKPGYAAAEVLFTDASGASVSAEEIGGGAWRFTMPASPVRVLVTFERRLSRGYTICSGDEDCILTPYTDAVSAEELHDALHFCLENGLLTPVSDTELGLEKAMSRAELLLMLWRMEGCPETDTDLSAFTDIDPETTDAETLDAIRWAVGAKIAVGCGEDAFCPDDGVTNEQAAMLLYRYALSKGYGFQSVVKNGSPVLRGSAWALAGLEWANTSGLLCGGTPAEGTASLADCASYVLRFHEIVLVNRIQIEIRTVG